MVKMRSRIVLLLFFISVVALSEGSSSYSLEARGKKKNQHDHYGLWIYFADLVVKKVFILKLVYAFVLWCVIHKAGFFLTWFVSYLKEQKKEHEHHDHGHHDHYPGGYGSYGPYRKSYKTR